MNGDPINSEADFQAYALKYHAYITEQKKREEEAKKAAGGGGGGSTSNSKP